jgi:hypothetical protein
MARDITVHEAYFSRIGTLEETLMNMSVRNRTLGLVGAAVVLFLVSASGQDGSYWASGPSWLGAIGWFGFLICLLLLIVTALYAVTSRMRHHDRSLPH